MSTLSKLSGHKMASMPAWEIASMLGCHYTGDCNAIPHGGAFYSTRDWKAYGYASCVVIEEIDGRILVSSGTINRSDDCTPENLAEVYGGAVEVTDDTEIDYCLGQWGFETDEDFGGRYSKWFPESTPENKIWLFARNWIAALAD